MDNYVVSVAALAVIGPLADVSQKAVRIKRALFKLKPPGNRLIRILLFWYAL